MTIKSKSLKARYDKLKKIWLPKDTVYVNCGKPATLRHHIIYADKKFDLPELYSHKFTITDKQMYEEIDKTIPLCRKCHRRFHLGVIVNPKLYIGPIKPLVEHFDPDKHYIFHGI